MAEATQSSSGIPRNQGDKGNGAANVRGAKNDESEVGTFHDESKKKMPFEGLFCKNLSTRAQLSGEVN